MIEEELREALVWLEHLNTLPANNFGYSSGEVVLVNDAGTELRFKHYSDGWNMVHG